MELRQLKYFLAIADSGSFSRAAQRVFVAQSALSHQMAQLEGELGASLFQRSRRGVALTDVGLRFYPHAVSILRQTEEAAQCARSGNAEPSGKVVFGIPHSVSQALALPLLRAVRQALPKVQLELTEELTGNLTPQLRAGQIQLAVLFDDGTLSEFAWTPMLRERLYLIGPPQASARRSAHVTLRQALARPLILPAHPRGVRPLIEAAAQSVGLAPPKTVTDISSISILRTSLLAGLGQTLLPLMPLKTDLDAGLLQATPVVSPPLERVLALCSSPHIPLSTAAQAVARLVLTVAAQLCDAQAWPGATLVTPSEAPVRPAPGSNSLPAQSGA
ncbi:MAG: LysR substrate-binding domain-containing protein [Hydrogenophaga sp.]|uniref:LysR family transcriptional regulator n=1 Tax=Hydrogenophaga sp. TaxID=1904254 RepID=UPI00274DE7CE|nr:LysR substrate-binding domain-containing protein [Hydrogenophaga sp.]MDP2419138.1 LysR substrate-binding domain-containing protein [Hydrogenophaga sp.]MDZ4187939.1 LysR substrate-binding domain-containing protein [Hydrogenophaga sp.]